jgi:hypothetical protein
MWKTEETTHLEDFASWKRNGYQTNFTYTNLIRINYTGIAYPSNSH